MHHRSGANNVGLTALQGLSGIAGVFQQEKQAQRQKEFQQAYANAYASGDRGALRQLATQYPDQIESVRNPETVARWLDAMANLERRNAQFNEFKAEWMSANGNPGQSRNGGQILGLDVKKGESLGSAVKRYMSMNTDAAPAQDSTPSGEPRNQVGSYTSKSGIQFTVE